MREDKGIQLILFYRSIPPAPHSLFLDVVRELVFSFANFQVTGLNVTDTCVCEKFPRTSPLDQV